MEKNKTAFKFAGTNIWFTCDVDKLEVTIAKARAANRLISTHPVEIAGAEPQPQEIKTKQKTSKNGNNLTPDTDNSVDSYFDRDADLYDAISELPQTD